MHRFAVFLLVIFVAPILGCDESSSSEEGTEAEERESAQEPSPQPDGDDEPEVVLAEELAHLADCEDSEPHAESSLIALGQLQIYRGTFDFEGARVAGCLYNRSDETLEHAAIHFQSREGGGISTTTRGLRFFPVKPGEATAFVSTVSLRGIDTYEEHEIEGYELVSVAASGDSRETSYDLEPPLEIDRIVAERNRHPIEDECDDIDPDDGDGQIWISHAAMAPSGLPGDAEPHIVGCVTNRSDEVIADGHFTRVSVGFEVDGGRRGVGTKSLLLQEPLEPEETAFFVSRNSLDRPHLPYTIVPLAGSDEIGPSFTVKPGQ